MLHIPFGQERYNIILKATRPDKVMCALCTSPNGFIRVATDDVCSAKPAHHVISLYVLK